MRPIGLCVFLAATALAQNPAPPAFEVASVKINPDFRQDNRATWSPRIETTPGSLTMRNVSLVMAVAWAYDVQRPQVVSPDWVDSLRYDIQAKAGAPAKDADMRLMLQTLLAERLKLQVHRESRQMDIMALLLPKSGSHKLKAVAGEGEAGNHQDPQRGRVIDNAALPVLLTELSRETQMPLIDMTGLTGRFEFTFNAEKYLTALRERVMAEGRPIRDEDARLMLMQDVIAGEMGLRLEPRKAPIDVIAIDRAEKTPVEN